MKNVTFQLMFIIINLKQSVMGNTQQSQEISLEEMEQFEMQVDEDYNPSGDLSERAARKQYH